MDDIVVFSQSMSEHRGHLEMVFQALIKANLKVNMVKCEFGIRELTFLGYRISQGKRGPTVKKLEQIRDFRRPETRKELESFLGVTGQFHSLIERYSELALPLTEMKNKTKVHAKLQWNETRVKAFEVLKAKLARTTGGHDPRPKEEVHSQDRCVRFGYGSCSSSRRLMAPDKWWNTQARRSPTRSGGTR